VWQWIFLVVAALSLQSNAATRDDLKANVKTLVRQLDGSILSDRDQAERALIELGPKILPLLPKAAPRTSAEVKQRVARVRQSLQKAAAISNSKASLITLQVKNTRLSKILTSIEKQTGNRIIDTRQIFGHSTADPRLSANFDKSPFWPTLDQIMDEANLTVYPFSNQGAIELVKRHDETYERYGKASYSGPFRFEAVRVTATRGLRNSANSTLQVVLEVAWEPR